MGENFHFTLLGRILILIISGIFVVPVAYLFGSGLVSYSVTSYDSILFKEIAHRAITFIVCFVPYIFICLVFLIPRRHSLKVVLILATIISIVIAGQVAGNMKLWKTMKEEVLQMGLDSQVVNYKYKFGALTGQEHFYIRFNLERSQIDPAWIKEGSNLDCSTYYSYTVLENGSSVKDSSDTLAGKKECFLSRKK